MLDGLFSASVKIWWTNFPSGRFYRGRFFRGRYFLKFPQRTLWLTRDA